MRNKRNNKLGHTTPHQNQARWTLQPGRTHEKSSKGAGLARKPPPLETRQISVNTRPIQSGETNGHICSHGLSVCVAYMQVPVVVHPHAGMSFKSIPFFAPKESIVKVNFEVTTIAAYLHRSGWKQTQCWEHTLLGCGY